MDTASTSSNIPSHALLPWEWPRAAYVHIPFCAHHCGYCDFAIATGAETSIDLYIEALTCELTTLGTPQPIDTLFLGGGTPTQLDARQLDRLLTTIDRWLLRTPSAESSVEANPDSISPDKVAELADHGIDRVSLGVQSFQPQLLKVLERVHNPEQVATAIKQIRQRIPRLSLDLIFGVPGQTSDAWNADLQRALSFQPDHISTYGLTFEKGTRLWKQQRAGGILALGDELEREMYLHAIETLETYGFEHYEVSNFARKGCRSRHNQVYWANEAYFGFGMGAARYVRGRREVNTRDLQDYLRRALAGTTTVFQSDELGPEERARETLAMNLRRGDGVRRDRFREQTGFDLDDLAGAKFTLYHGLGLLVDDGRTIRLTPDGFCVADTIVGSVI